ncbi:MAG: trans-aconitate 2-methyltransferase [Gemmatimonadota bacterium]
MEREGVRETFERLSADYDARFPAIIPRYSEFHGVIVQRAAEHPPPHPARGASPGPWIDLGCGTGELSRRLLDAMPTAHVHAVDLSPAMVERARAKLAPWAGRVTYDVADVRDAELPARVSGVVSALAVHHLEADEKRALFRRLARALQPGGLLVLGDAVTGGTAAYTRYYVERWAEHMRASGLTEDEIARVLDDHRRNDRFSSLEEHVEWLRAAGFTDVECLWKHFLLVVLAAELPLS